MDHRGKTTQVCLFSPFFRYQIISQISDNDSGCFLPPRLKAALARRTGRSEEELCFEERRRSARVAEEENHSLEEILERGKLRARKEESKLSEVCDPLMCFSVTVWFFLQLILIFFPAE